MSQWNVFLQFSIHFKKVIEYGKVEEEEKEFIVDDIVLLWNNLYNSLVLYAFKWYTLKYFSYKIQNNNVPGLSYKVESFQVN